MNNWKQKLKHHWKDGVYKALSFLVTYVGQGLVRLILFSCRWEIKGLERFKEIASSHPCILSIWHNRLALTPSIVTKFAPDFIYAALISKSRDGELISAVVESYKIGRTIRVSPQNRPQALLDIIYHLQQLEEVVIITPDGPRGPMYQVKPGIAWIALETGAYVVPLTWTSSKYWEFNTWDKLRLPKPFTKINVTFGEPLHFEKSSGIKPQEISEILADAMMK